MRKNYASAAGFRLSSRSGADTAADRDGWVWTRSPESGFHTRKHEVPRVRPLRIGLDQGVRLHFKVATSVNKNEIKGMSFHLTFISVAVKTNKETSKQKTNNKTENSKHLPVYRAVPLSTVAGSVQLCSHFRKRDGSSSES